MQKVLAVYFSQSGQLQSIVQSILGPITSMPRVEVTHCRPMPVKAYPFPWPFFRFFDIFPEAVLLDSPEMQTIDSDPDEEYDLVLLAWQPWFLSPSLPVTGFLRSDFARRVLEGKPVITVVGCRNMWLEAHKQVSKMLSDCGAKLIDHIVLTDPGPVWATFISTPYWMLTGKQAIPGLPKAGISAKQIHEASRFGHAIAQGLRDGRVREASTLLRGLGAVHVNPFLIDAERVGKRSFLIWGWLIRQCGPQGNRVRLVFVALYVCILVLLITLALPVASLLHRGLYPWQKQRLLALKASLEEPSGSDRSLVGMQPEGV